MIERGEHRRLRRVLWLWLRCKPKQNGTSKTRTRNGDRGRRVESKACTRLYGLRQQTTWS
eukprot:4926085-Pleurochrysis_carterae.AAC.1